MRERHAQKGIFALLQKKTLITASFVVKALLCRLGRCKSPGLAGLCIPQNCQMRQLQFYCGAHWSLHHTQYAPMVLHFSLLHMAVTTVLNTVKHPTLLWESMIFTTVSAVIPSVPRTLSLMQVYTMKETETKTQTIDKNKP